MLTLVVRPYEYVFMSLDTMYVDQQSVSVSPQHIRLIVLPFADVMSAGHVNSGITFSSATSPDSVCITMTVVSGFGGGLESGSSMQPPEK